LDRKKRGKRELNESEGVVTNVRPAGTSSSSSSFTFLFVLFHQFLLLLFQFYFMSSALERGAQSLLKWLGINLKWNLDSSLSVSKL
jgi:hypothetical protein